MKLHIHIFSRWKLKEYANSRETFQWRYCKLCRVMEVNR